MNIRLELSKAHIADIDTRIKYLVSTLDTAFLGRKHITNMIRINMTSRAKILASCPVLAKMGFRNA